MMINEAENSRINPMESLKKIIPIAIVPTAPIPVHTAYAVPIGMLRCARNRKNPLNAIDTMDIAINNKLC